MRVRMGAADGALVLGLLLAGALGWALVLRAPLEVDAAALGALPPALLDWEARDVPIEETVERMLRADQHVQRAYYDPAGGLVWLYVGYYGTERGGRSEHSPFVCYPAAGWRILDDQTRTVALPGGRGRVQEIVVERGAEQRLVHFWYRTHRSAHVVGALAHAWDRFVGRLLSGRADGAFVRLSAPLGGADREAVRARLLTFGRALDAQLERHWPRERRRAGATRPGDAGSAPAPAAI